MTSATSSSLVTRVINILTKPAQEWDVIRGEGGGIKALFTGYAAPLALIGPICGLIASLLFVGLLGPIGIGGVLVGGIVGAVLGYVLNLVAVFLLGIIIDALASSFGAQPNREQAMKVAVYSMTAAWVGALLNLVPGIGWLLAGLVSLYGIYLLYLGLKQVMGAPDDKAIIYTLVVVVIMAVILGVIGFVLGLITAAFMMGGMAAAGAGAYAVS